MLIIAPTVCTIKFGLCSPASTTEDKYEKGYPILSRILIAFCFLLRGNIPIGLFLFLNDILTVPGFVILQSTNELYASAIIKSCLILCFKARAVDK